MLNSIDVLEKTIKLTPFVEFLLLVLATLGSASLKTTSQMRYSSTEKQTLTFKRSLLPEDFRLLVPRDQKARRGATIQAGVTDLVGSVRATVSQ